MLAPMVAALPADVAGRYPHGYAVVDVETSGLSSAHHRVLQVAVCQVRADGALEAEWSTLLNPDCDPGPVHIHGLTRERLRGAPLFSDIAPHLVQLIRGRVLVAHNARFDWDFLSCEAKRARAELDVSHRLCTIALSRRLDLPLTSLSLESVAAYWRVPQLRAHDAVDDSRVVVEVLRHSLATAHRLGATLPLAPCTTSATDRAVPVSAPRPPCLWRHPGPWRPGTSLQQGMKVVITGDTAEPRDQLIRRASAAGLDMMNSVSSRTNVLVCNNVSTVGTRKAEMARHHGIPVVTETDFTSLMNTLRPGDPKGPGSTAMPAGRARPVAASASAGALAKHRILVLGGTHEQGAAVRERIAEAGGQAAANLTTSITDVVLLADHDRDQRWPRVSALELPRLDPATLHPVAEDHVPSAEVHQPTEIPDPIVLPPGGVTDLALDVQEWSLSIAWPDRPAPIEVDVAAFVVDQDEQVGTDEDFCFYNQTAHPTQALELDLDIPNEAVATIRPEFLPADRQRIVLAAAIDGDQTFGDVGPIELVLRTGDGNPAVRATLDAATGERSLLLANFYHRNGVWRLRAVGQGYQANLAGLAVMHGVDIEES